MNVESHFLGARRDGKTHSDFPGFRYHYETRSMHKDDCLLIGRNDHVIMVGPRDTCFHWLKSRCPDGEYVVRGPGIDLYFYRIGGVVYPCGGTVDGSQMPTRSPAECLAFFAAGG